MTEHDSAGRPGGIRSAARTFDVIEELRRRESAGVTELATHFDIAKSTAHDYLATLERRGYVVKEDDEYRLGIRFLQLGGHVRDTCELYRRLYATAKPEIDKLADETGENVQMIIEEDGLGYILYQSRGNRSVMTDSHIGTEVYLHCTAVGKSILAHLPEERVDKIVAEHGLPQKTENTVADREELKAEFAKIHETGFAFDHEEQMSGMRCVARPIRTEDGEILGAMSVSGPTRRFNGERFESELPELVRQVTRMIELDVTYL